MVPYLWKGRKRHETKVARTGPVFSWRRLLQYAESLQLKDSSTDGEACEILFFSHDVDRQTKLGDKPFSPILDLLSLSLQQAGFNTAHISFFGSKQLDAYPETRVKTINRGYFKAYITDRLWSFLESKISFTVSRSNNVERLFRSLINQSKASLVFTIGLPKSLASAAHKEDVYLIEILHGFGYGQLPWGYETRAGTELAHEFWVGDSFSLKSFSQLEKHGVINTLVRPMQLVTPKTSQQGSGRPTSSLELQIGPNPTPLDDIHPKRVLFAVSRGGYFGQAIDTGSWDWGLIEDVISSSASTTHWFFRLHPMQLAEGSRSRIFREITRLTSKYSTCEWEWASSTPPAFVYGRMDCLITWGSEAVFDAHYAGLASGVILPGNISPLEAPGRHEAFDFLAEEGSLTFLRPVSTEIGAWVENSKPTNPSSRSDPSAKDFHALIQRCGSLVNAKN